MLPLAELPVESQGMKVNARITRPIVRPASITRRIGFFIFFGSSRRGTG